jgi:hypothetical protein
MATNATGSGGIQLAGNAGAALYGPSIITVTRLLTFDETTTGADLIDSISAAIRRYLLFTPQGFLSKPRVSYPGTEIGATSPTPQGLLDLIPHIAFIRFQPVLPQQAPELKGRRSLVEKTMWT